MGQGYKRDMQKAARRHYTAGETLFGTHRKDVAGYLYGLAGECALKAMMLKSGMKPADPRQKDDPFYAHFESLKSLISSSAQGRFQGELLKYVNNQAFFQHWDITMRYSDGKDIESAWVESWKKSAQDVITEMETM